MTVLWVVTGIALAVAIAALAQARRTARRLAQLSDMHWELKYQHFELRTQVQRMPGAEAAAAPPASPAAPAPGGQPGEAFVPLASLRR